MKINRRFFGVVIILTVNLSLLLAQSVKTNNKVWMSKTAISSPLQIGVYYYPWYYNDFHGGNYFRKHLRPQQMPVLGEYNDRTTTVINQHLAWSRYAKVSLWVTSWWGPRSREDITLLTSIFPNPFLGNLKIAAFYETIGLTDNFTNFNSVGRDITYLANHYFNQTNYFKINDKPVLYVYLTRVLSSMGTLDSLVTIMRTAASSAGYQLYIVGDQVFGYPPTSSTAIGLLDGITNYDVYGSMGASGYAAQSSVDAYYSAQAEWKSLAQSLNVGFIPGVSPGFNDSGVRTGHSPLSRQLTPTGSSGSLFKAMLLGAKALTDSTIGSIIMVTSWNEWHEDTQIEPVNPAPGTSLDDSPSGHDYTNGISYEGYGTLYLDILRSIEQNNSKPSKAFKLLQNYPNPFNSETTIEYQLPVTSNVDLSIYNILGQKVITLVSEKQSDGNYRAVWNAGLFGSGIYIYRLETDNGFSKSQKLVLLK